ncbi:MAG: rod shape-determining protein RodA [Candidatus Coatesbacteria bacterium]|nr:MAG: rod shape-determining protein RodA [Candidatus Coatesbacteria bacterium]
MLDRRVIQNINWWLILVAVVLSLIGVATIYAATFGTGPQANMAYRGQLKWLVLGLVAMTVTMFVDYNRLIKAAYIIQLAASLVLVAVLLFAEPIAGSKRWLDLGFVRFQPSELAKITTVLALVKLFSSERLRGRPWLQILGGVVIVAVPAALIVKQPDFGTAVMFLIPFIVLAIVAQRRLLPIVLTVLAGALSALPGWFFLKAYQRQRIIAFIDPSYDELGSGYQAIQSKIAVGSGGVLGKGFAKSTQVRLHFLPAQHTDFIFSVHAEEQGFLGSLLVLGLFMLLVGIAFSIARHAKNRAGLLLAVGCTSLIAGQFLINIAMVIGFLPITGLPLPFMSYGGSSLTAVFIMLGLLESVQMRRFAF